MPRNIAAGQLQQTFMEGEYSRKCSKCKRPVYYIDKCFKTKNYEYMCIECAIKLNAEFGVQNETASRWGLTLKEADELANDIIRQKKLELGIGIAA